MKIIKKKIKCYISEMKMAHLIRAVMDEPLKDCWGVTNKKTKK